MDLLASPGGRFTAQQNNQINNILKSSNVFQKELIAQKVQGKMRDVTPGDWVDIIKETIKAVLIDEYKIGAGAEFSSMLNKVF